MSYYYFDLQKKQYLFPENYREYSLFKGFYQAYTLKGQLMWSLFDGMKAFRKLFRVRDLSSFVPIAVLQPYLSSDAIVAFNRGTVGVEQKISLLGIDTVTQKSFFIKYAETDIARRNVNNEGEVLAQLKDLDFVPKIEKQITESAYSLIQTNVLKGERVNKQEISKQLLEVLLQLSEQKIQTKKQYSTKLKSCFAHGDCCPWNMMLDDGALKIYDWEMAGIYPLGYDLFTYIFQPLFLLKPKTPPEECLKQNTNLIQSYFDKFSISDWMPYLLAFATTKLELEKAKNSTVLMNHYKRLHEYAEKI